MMQDTPPVQDAPHADLSLWEAGDVTGLIATLTTIRVDLLTLEAGYSTQIAGLPDGQRDSARNLLHYIALRGHDLRPLQGQLAHLGLSSLGRSEAHVLATIDAVLAVLHRLAGSVWHPPAGRPRLSFQAGRSLLDRNTRSLLKAMPRARGVRIMVTMPREAATDYGLVRDLLAGGMDIMRINYAHDTPEVWAAMIAHLRQAEAEVGRQGYVSMDLAGPKLRTGSMVAGPKVVKWRPRRDALGRTVAPARILLASADAPLPALGPADAILPLPTAWLKGVRIGDEIVFHDSRQAQRSLTVIAAAGSGWWTECHKTAYVTPGIYVSRRGHGRRGTATAPIGDLPSQAEAILLRTGDTLILTRAQQPGHAATYDTYGHVTSPATIGCTLPDVFTDVQAGEAIWLDDGKIGGAIRSVSADQMQVDITQARATGDKLRADKGINLPDSTLHLPALTPQDLANLPFVVTHADMVGYSFVRSPQDIATLQTHLSEIGGDHLGIVLKIETRAAFEALPALLLAAMRSPCAGVMIARGDLAVECGYERMAELQEEILCIAEAAHMPVIWATQVLETLAQEGTPSRAEISDAAMGERAECVMLNKGPYIVDAVRVLDGVLQRMQGQQSKKKPMLRQLRLARRFQRTGQ